MIDYYKKLSNDYVLRLVSKRDSFVIQKRISRKGYNFCIVPQTYDCKIVFTERGSKEFVGWLYLGTPAVLPALVCGIYIILTGDPLWKVIPLVAVLGSLGLFGSLCFVIFLLKSLFSRSLIIENNTVKCYSYLGLALLAKEITPISQCLLGFHPWQWNQSGYLGPGSIVKNGTALIVHFNNDSFTIASADRQEIVKYFDSLPEIVKTIPRVPRLQIRIIEHTI